MMRRDEEYVGKRVMRMDVEGRRRKGRPKQRWMDSVNVDLREKGLSGRRCTTGLCGCINRPPPIEVGKDAEEEDPIISSYCNL